MPAVPSYSTRDLATVPYLLSEDGLRAAADAPIKSGQTSALTPTYRIPPGTVIIKGASTQWYQADHASALAATAAAITSSGHVDVGAVDAVIVGPHATITVTMSTGTGTEAECATDLNADVGFNSLYIATSGSGELTITARATGADWAFYMDALTDPDFNFAEGDANAVRGTDPEVRVTAFWVDLEDIDGVAVDALAPTHYAGHFDESVLANLTSEAKTALIRQGSRFE